MSKHYPEVTDKYQELTDSINALTDINKEVKIDATSWDFPIFCKFLEFLAESVIAIGYYGFDFIYGILVTLFPKLEYIIWYIFDLFWGLVAGVLTAIGVLGIIFCHWGSYYFKMENNYI